MPRFPPRLKPLLALAVVLCGALFVPFWPFRALAAIVCLYCLPGHAFVEATGWGRDWNRAGRVILVVALSVVLTPLLLNPIWHWTSDGRWACLAVGACSATVIGVGALRGRRNGGLSAPCLRGSRRLSRTRLGALLLGGIALWVAAAAFFAYWPGDIGGGPIPQTGIHDYIKHHAVMLELEHTLPLGNPFFADGAREAVYYYHFFYLAPAALRSISGGALSIAFAFALAAAVVAGSIIAMAYLFVKRLSGSDAAGVLAALLAGPIGGFDILPLIAQQRLVVTLDAWADTPLRVHNLLTQYVWTPQNSQGLLLALIAAYGLSAAGVFWRGWLAAAPLLASSLVGTSIWLAALLLPGAAIIAAWQIFKRPGRARAKLRRAAAALAIAGLTLALSGPQLAGYAETSLRHGKSLVLTWDGYSSNAVLGRLAAPGVFANLLDLPWLLFLEFGPLLVLPLLLRRAAWRRANADPGLSWLMMTSVLAVVAFAGVRSNFTYNDFGHRIIMIPLLTGALLGALIACDFGPRPRSNARASRIAAAPVRKWIILASLAIGLPVGLYQAPATAGRRFIEYRGTLAAREGAALRYLRDRTPHDAVVQADCDDSDRNPTPRLWLCQLIDRQIGVLPLQEDTLVFQGRGKLRQERVLGEFRAALEAPCSAADRHAVLRRHGVNYVLVGAVERAHWVDLATFDDPAYFERVFADEQCRVYRVK